MNTSWWRSKEELDVDQKKFIELPVYGKHSLVGPPGSGKTNLLLLRALFIAGTGEKNVLIITYTNALADFIRTGIAATGLISSKQVNTFHKWAFEHILEYLGEYPIPKDTDFNEKSRIQILEHLKQANQKLPTTKLYSAIFVDEAQDLTVSELDALLCLSDNVCICGDSQQGIYNRDGLDIAKKLGLEQHALTRHYRIGQKIAHVADRILPPGKGEDSLESTSNYNPKSQGDSSAKMHACTDRDEQFSKMLELIRVQLDAFKGELVGIFCGKNESLKELRERFNGTDISDLVCVHGSDDRLGFGGDCLIHALTIHASKGTEFRAVHLYGAEELATFPFNRTKLNFTAVTRAKTALNVFRTGDTNPRLEGAFSELKHIEIDDLFPGDGE